jgi:hypothetical protein
VGAAQGGEPGAALLRRTAVGLTISLSVANLVGAAATFAFGNFVLPPLPEIEDPAEARTASLVGLGAYMLIGIPFGTWWTLHRARPAREWRRRPEPLLRHRGRGRP